MRCPSRGRPAPCLQLRVIARDDSARECGRDVRSESLSLAVSEAQVSREAAQIIRVQPELLRRLRVAATALSQRVAHDLPLGPLHGLVVTGDRILAGWLLLEDILRK